MAGVSDTAERRRLREKTRSQADVRAYYALRQPNINSKRTALAQRADALQNNAIHVNKITCIASTVATQ